MPLPPFIVVPVTGTGYRSYVDGPRGTAAFVTPKSMDMSPDGRILYVADHGANAIRTVNPITGYVDTLISLPGGPQCVVVGPTTGNLYVTYGDNNDLNNYNGTLGVFSPTGTLLRTYTGWQRLRCVGVSTDETGLFVTWVLVGGGWNLPRVSNVLTNTVVFNGGNFQGGMGCAVDDDGNLWWGPTNFAGTRRMSQTGVFREEYPGDAWDIRAIRGARWVTYPASNRASLVDLHDDHQYRNFIPAFGAEDWVWSICGTSEAIYFTTCPIANNRGSFGAELYNVVAIGANAGDACKIWRLDFVPLDAVAALRLHQRADDSGLTGAPRISGPRSRSNTRQKSVRVGPNSHW